MKATLLLLFLSVLGPMAAARAVTFNLAGDWLADEEGIQGIPNGSLILLIASTLDTKFSPPLDRGIIDPRSDERLLGAFAASDDGNRSNRGCFAKTIQVNLGDKSQGLEHFGGGDPVMVRWFPTLSLEDLDALPNESIPYGEFRADEVLLGSNATWVAPASNSATINLSIVSKATGNRYKPNGTLAAQGLAAYRSVERLFSEVAHGKLTISTVANGSLALTWPLRQGADPVGKLQQSSDLIHWSESDVEIDLSNEGVASAHADTEGHARFYRISD